MELVIVGARISVIAARADLHAGANPGLALGYQGGQVHALQRHRQRIVEELSRPRAVHAGQPRNIQVHIRHRRSHHSLNIHRARGQNRAVHTRPAATGDTVVHHHDRGPRLVAQHRVQRIREPIAAVLLAILRRGQPVVVHRRLLTHQVHDLITRHRRMHRLDERGDTHRVRRSERRSAAVGVVRRHHVIGDRRFNIVARRGEINALPVVREVGTQVHLAHAFRHHPLAGDRTDLIDPLNHLGDHHAALPARRGQIRTVVGKILARRVIIVRVIVGGSRENRDPLTASERNRARRRLQTRRLLRVRRIPVAPRAHHIRIVHDIHAVINGPRERARQRLRVRVALGVSGLDRHDRRIGSDAVDTVTIVVSGNNAGDHRAVRVIVLPRAILLVRHAIPRTRHRMMRIHAPDHVGMAIIHTRVDNAHNDGSMRNRHRGGLGRVHGDAPPVRQLFVRPSRGRNVLIQRGHVLGGYRSRFVTALRTALTARFGGGLRIGVKALGRQLHAIRLG